MPEKRDSDATELKPSEEGKAGEDDEKLPQKYRDEVLEENKDKLDPNAKGETTGFELNKEPVNSALKVKNVKIPKPEVVKDNESQRIPLEYQNLIE